MAWSRRPCGDSSKGWANSWSTSGEVKKRADNTIATLDVVDRKLAKLRAAGHPQAKLEAEALRKWEEEKKAEEAKNAALREGKSDEDAMEAADQAKRTPAEKAAFKHALHETMDLWYAHQGTTVFLLTQHPRDRGSQREQGYEESGWTTYERCSAEQIKKVYLYQAKWKLVLD